MIMKHVAPVYDVGTAGASCMADVVMQGFKRGFQFAEVVQVLRTVTERAAGWEIPC